MQRSQFLSKGKDKSPDFLSAAYIDIIPNLVSLTTYQVPLHQQGALDSIAYEIYGDDSYWWVLGMFNGIINPMFEVIPGLILNIPDKSSIDSQLAKLSSGSENSTGQYLTI